MKKVSILLLNISFFMMPIANASDAKTNMQTQQCGMPHAAFKYSYLDSVINLVAKPSDTSFLGSASESMDVVKAQFYLWYLYRNPTLSAGFFKRVNISKLVERNDDSLNAMLWLMARGEDYFSSINEVVKNKVNRRLGEWKAGYEITNPQRSLVLDLYANDNYPLTKFSSERKNYVGDDVDLVLRMGILSENAGKKLEALYYYTKVAEFGYQNGLVGASILLPILGGDICVGRAAYYAKLSGAIAPISWLAWDHKH